MKKFLKNHQVLGVMLSVLASVFLVTLISYSATTISTNIVTGGYASSTGNLYTTGNLWVGANATTSGNHRINGNATTSKSHYFGGFASSTTSFNTDGTLWVGGNATTSGIHYINGVASTTELHVQGDALIGGYATTTNLTIGTSTTHIHNLLYGTCSVNPGNVGAEATSTASCTATGVQTGWRVFLTPPSLEKYLIYNGASSTAANTITIQLSNATGTQVTTAARTWDWLAIR